MRRVVEKFVALFSWGGTFLLLFALVSVLIYLFQQGSGAIGIDLIFGDVSPTDALSGRKQVFDGLLPALAGTLALVLVAIGFALPVGLAAGIYMAEYARGSSKQVLTLLFDVLAGLPSIVVGLAGFSLTILLHRIMPDMLGPCLLLSAMALSFLVLPYFVRGTQLALETIPVSLRITLPALGASKLQNILYVLLPSRLPNIVSTIILAIGRTAEDTAVIMLTGVVVSAGMPRSLFEQFEALPFYIYYISSQYTHPEEIQMGFGAALILLSLCSILFVAAFLLEQVISWRMRR